MDGPEGGRGERRWRREEGGKGGRKVGGGGGGGGQRREEVGQNLWFLSLVGCIAVL